MAYLAKARKLELIEICEELGIEVDSSSKVPDLKKLILSSEFYEEEEVKIILERVLEDRKQQREERREANQHELELKKLELLHRDSRQRDESEQINEKNSRIQLTQITPKFDEKQDEMGLYLINFERRAEMAQVPKKHWVAYLLAVLPPELSNMLARESPSDANDYDFVKSLILKRYRLNSEKLKQCFYRHHKSNDKSWRNYAQELNSYFTEWINELQIETFQELKDLIVTEQLKFRVPAEVRDHFLEGWLKFTTPFDLAEKLDDYESIKESFKRKDGPKKNFSNFRSQSGNFQNHKHRDNVKEFRSKFQVKPEASQEKSKEKDFDRRKPLRCFECGSTNHLRPQCDKLKKAVESISHVMTEESSDELMSRYTSIGKVNGVEMKILRDTGSTLDLISNKYVKPYMFTNEEVWLRTPLEENLVCLPLVEVELDCEMGHIITKAAVVINSLDQGKYLLGNKTAALFEAVKTKKDVQMRMLNAVKTRAHKKLLETEKDSKLHLNKVTSDSSYSSRRPYSTPLRPLSSTSSSYLSTSERKPSFTQSSPYTPKRKSVSYDEKVLEFLNASDSLPTPSRKQKSKLSSSPEKRHFQNSKSQSVPNVRKINEKNGSSFSKSETVIDVCDASSSQIVPEQIQDSEISNKSECSASISKIVPEKTTGTIVKNIKVSEDVLQVENMLKNTETEPKRMEKSDSRSSPISGLEKVIRELREREKDLMAAIEAKDSQLAILKIRLQEADQELKLKRNVAKELEVENEKMIKEHAQSAVFQNKTVEVLQEQLQQTETELNKTKDSLLQNKINTRKKKKYWD